MWIVELVDRSLRLLTDLLTSVPPSTFSFFTKKKKSHKKKSVLGEEDVVPLSKTSPPRSAIFDGSCRRRVWFCVESFVGMIELVEVVERSNRNHMHDILCS